VSFKRRAASRSIGGNKYRMAPQLRSFRTYTF
jgi:hypothetical protein